MPFLSYLSLSTNHCTGPIEVPNSSFPSRINTLLLGYNRCEGNIIKPISKLTNLKTLDLSFLTISYPINLSLFSSLTFLSYLDLSGNSISPAILSSSDSYILLTLGMFSLRHCGISEFPNILKTLENLEYINLSYNRIQGKIPVWLWSLPQLSTVDIMNNSFNGFAGSTESLVNSSVGILNLINNNFGGALPHLPLSINFFFASSNNFTGEIPLSICYRSLLSILDLSYNNLVGPIPQCLSNLQIVKLRKNNLEGIIPDVFYKGSLTETLDVSYNRLTGKLPRSLLNCYLNVENNRTEDTFPFWLKSLPNLQVVILRSNIFYGPISPSHQGPLGFPELRVLEISDNKFTGSLPSSYFVNWKASLLTMNEDGNLYMVYDKVVNGTVHYFYMDSIDLQYKGSSMKQVRVLTSYATIDFSGNKLEGKIPESIGLLKALIALNLSNNAFTGHIPMSLANLVKLESLDLSRNQISGSIPNGLRTLSYLEYINVSHNQLKGEIPQGTQIMGQPISSFEWNPGLCGLPLQQSCFGNNKPTIHQPKQEDNGEEEEDEEEVLNWKAVVIGYGVGVLFGLSIAQGIASYKSELLVKIVGAKKCRRF